MKVAGLVLALAYSAAAFAPNAQRAGRTSLSAANLEDMAGSTMPFKAWDPFELASLGSDETLAWFRAAELKNELLRRGGPIIVNYRYQFNKYYFTCISQILTICYLNLSYPLS